jgi:hypothetical protein
MKLTEMEQSFLVAVLGIVMVAVLLRFVVRRLVSDDARDAARYRVLRETLELTTGEDGDLFFVGIVLHDWEMTKDRDETIARADVPFLAAAEVDHLNGDSSGSTGVVTGTAAIDRTVDWLDTRRSAVPSGTISGGFDGVTA